MYVRLVSFLVTVLLLLSGCGATSGHSTSAPTLRIWYGTDDPVERSWAATLAARFALQHPSIHVAFQTYSFEDINTKLQLALSGGNPPDLAYVTPRGPGIPAYVGAGRLRDLTAPAQSHRWARALRPGLLALYNAPFSHLGLPRGHVVAVPTSLAAVALLYNARLLHRLHLAVPATIPDFERDLALAKRAGYTSIGMGNADGWLGDDWYLTLVNALLPTAALRPEQNLDPHFTFKQPAMLRAGRILQGWARHGYFTHGYAGLDAQEGVSVFFQGRTLFQLVSSSENSQIVSEQRHTGLPIGVTAFPGAGGAVMPQSGYEGWVVPRAAAHAREAISFLDFVLSPATARFLMAQGQIPTHWLGSGQTQRGTVATGESVSPWEHQFLSALATARPGIYLDAAPITNINATMEANVQLLLGGYEGPDFLVRSLEEVYTSHGRRGSTARIDGEF